MQTQKLTRSPHAIDCSSTQCAGLQMSMSAQAPAHQQSRRACQQHRTDRSTGCGWPSSTASVSGSGCKGILRNLRGGVCAAADPDSEGQLPQEQSFGEAGVLLRLALVSFAGAAVVKYGELLLGDVPYSHNLPLALAMIVGPCLLYSAYLAVRSASEKAS